MEHERKHKIQNKKRFDQQHRYTFKDEENILKNKQKKQFKQKKQQMFDDDSWEELEEYE